MKPLVPVRARLGAAALLTAMALAGCYEDVTPTNYEAGVYKGSEDPLRAKLEDGALHDQLGERGETAFRDR